MNKITNHLNKTSIHIKKPYLKRYTIQHSLKKQYHQSQFYGMYNTLFLHSYK